MLKRLTIARAMGSVATPLKRRNGVAGITGLVLWERNSDGPLEYVAPNHNTLSVYQGGGSRTWSYEERAWGFSDAICLLPEGYDSHWAHNGYVKNLHLYFTNQDLEALNWAVQDRPEPLIYGRQPVLRSLSAALVHDLDWDEGGNRLAVDHIVLAMLSQMSRAETTQARELPASTLDLIEARMQALEAGVAALSELADLAGLSARHLTRVYKATQGQTLSQRQREIQVDLAQNMLMGQAPLSEIAHACGFSSQSHFSSVFRKMTGQTPGAWRRMSKP